MKKWTAIILTLALAFSLALPAAADDSTVAAETGGQDSVETVITALGGVPGQVNVLWGGQCIAFPDAAPELRNGRTMVPIRAIMEDLGAEVTYGEDQVVTCTLGGATITFAVGAAEAAVERDGTTETITLDSPSYLKDNRTYVPLRFISEASGYDVFWDNTARTAVILDREDWIARLDENLSILNGMLADQAAFYDPDQSYAAEYTLDGSLSLLDAGSAGTAFAFGGDLSLLWRGTDYEMSGSLDLEEMMDQLLPLLLGMDAAAIQDLLPDSFLQQLNNPEFALILNSQGYWLHMPLLDYLMAGDPIEQWDELMAQDTWYDVSALLGVDMGELLEAASVTVSSDATMGSLLYDQMVSTMELLGQAGSLSYLNAPEALAQTKDLLDTFFGDDTFTRSGTSYRWSIDLEDLIAYTERLTGETVDPADLAGVAFSMEMTVGQNGETDFTYAFSMNNESGSGSFIMSGVSGAERGSLDLALAVSGLMDLEVSMDYTCRETSATPAAQPPADAVVVDSMA